MKATVTDCYELEALIKNTEHVLKIMREIVTRIKDRNT